MATDTKRQRTAADNTDSSDARRRDQDTEQQFDVVVEPVHKVGQRRKPPTPESMQAAEWRKDVVLRRMWNKWTGPNSAPGEGAPDAPCWGELNHYSTLKLLSVLKLQCGLGTAHTSFLDIGSGRGTVVMAARYLLPSVACTGVEVSKDRYYIGLVNLGSAKLTGCALHYGDFSTCTAFFGASVIYAFDKGFPRTPGKGPLHAMAVAWNRPDTTARYMVTSRTPRFWQVEMGLRHVDVVEQLCLSAIGGEAHQFYILERTFDDEEEVACDDVDSE